MDDAMNAENPHTRTMPISEVKRTLSYLADEVHEGNTRVLIEKSDVPVAALVSVRDLERLSQLDDDRAERRQILETLREPFRGVPTEEIEREAAKALAEVRAERRAAREASVKSA